jgi:hypothetical protein
MTHLLPPALPIASGTARLTGRCHRGFVSEVQTTPVRSEEVNR